MKRTFLALAASLAAISLAQAQQVWPDGDAGASPSAPIGSVVIKTLDNTGKAKAVSPSNGLTIGASDGGLITLGSMGDSPWSGTGSASEIALLKAIYGAATGSIPPGSNVIGKIQPDHTTPGSTDLFYSQGVTYSHASVTILGSSLVAKASAGTLAAFNCTAITGGAAGYCIAYNGTAAPLTGALTGANVIESCYFDTTAKGCNLSHLPNNIAMSTGIVILVTSAATPFTYTTGTNTAFIEADYQ